jgi:peptidoglycan/LPS O-acetylase OafA/YrhL
LATPASDFFGAVSLGVTAAVIQRDHFPDWHLRPWSIAILVLSALLLFISTYLGFIPYLLGSALSAIFIVLATAQPGRKASTVAEFMGGMSYPLYLHHWIGLWLASVLVRRLKIDNLTFQVSAIVISLIIAATMYLLIDVKVRARRSHYFTPARGQVLATTGYVLVTIGTLFGLTHLQ